MATSATSHIEEGQARTWKTRWRLSGVIKNRNYQAHFESVILTTAFRHATSSRCKTDVIEIDLHETLDGVAVVCHDPNLQRLCGRDIEVSQVNFCGKRIIASIRQPSMPTIVLMCAENEHEQLSLACCNKLRTFHLPSIHFYQT